MVQHKSAVSVQASGPVRTCVGCRKRVLSAELLRFVAHLSGNGHSVVPDPKRRRPGRGGWIHRSSECLQNAERRRAFGRALKVSTVLDLTELGEFITQLRPGEEPANTDVTRHLEKKRQQQP